jgi:hypothetical protein
MSVRAPTVRFLEQYNAAAFCATAEQRFAGPLSDFILLAAFSKVLAWTVEHSNAYLEVPICSYGSIDSARNRRRPVMPIGRWMQEWI